MKIEQVFQRYKVITTRLKKKLKERLNCMKKYLYHALHKKKKLL